MRYCLPVENNMLKKYFFLIVFYRYLYSSLKNGQHDINMCFVPNIGCQKKVQIYQKKTHIWTDNFRDFLWDTGTVFGPY